ncbi:SDR family NAD(P)-dependent oxidoreductase [Sphingomonas fuzhouensis]|uniref:SDR family NAD(P)-dependent oxidoreductase n=1 Tax=Sphingomonas fuzhouensis TaxID=3106033 RepID=UPI002AFFBB9C|nr:SDR family oxidoreductase [Sphingomonas sp. SGZ-02]
MIVTGASRGIGAAIAERLAGQGHMVACLSRSGGLPDRPTATPEIRRRWLPLKADVTDVEGVRRAFVEACEGRRLIGLVNNAGLHTNARSEDLTLADWNTMIAANATSVLVGCQSAYPYLTGAGGLIVNIGSFFDKLGVKQNLAYCASKAAVGAITRVLAVEWAAKGIGVINVAPGYIVTDLNRDAMTEGPLRAYLDKRIPRGAPGSEEDIASLVDALFAMDRRFLTGETIYVDGAQGIAH